MQRKPIRLALGERGDAGDQDLTEEGVHERPRLFLHRTGCWRGAGRAGPPASCICTFSPQWSFTDQYTQYFPSRNIISRYAFTRLYVRGRKPRVSALKMALGGGLGSLSRSWSHLHGLPTWNWTEMEARGWGVPRGLGGAAGGRGVCPSPRSRLLERHPGASGWNIPPAQRDSRKATALCVQKALFLPKRTAVCYKD